MLKNGPLSIMRLDKYIGLMVTREEIWVNNIFICSKVKGQGCTVITNKNIKSLIQERIWNKAMLVDMGLRVSI